MHQMYTWISQCKYFIRSCPEMMSPSQRERGQPKIDVVRGLGRKLLKWSITTYWGRGESANFLGKVGGVIINSKWYHFWTAPLINQSMYGKTYFQAISLPFALKLNLAREKDLLMQIIKYSDFPLELQNNIKTLPVSPHTQQPLLCHDCMHVYNWIFLIDYFITMAM